MKITKRHLRRIIREHTNRLDELSGMGSEKWQQEIVNKTNLLKRLETLKGVLQKMGTDLIVITDEEAGSLTDNEVRLIVKREGSIMGIGKSEEKDFKIIVGPNGYSIKQSDAPRGSEQEYLLPAKLERWLWDNVISESKTALMKNRLKRIIREEYNKIMRQN